ncbi:MULTISPECIES: hypothetical protein [Paraburkholderia]|uniref:hypothetical protein n=1 Tax=Paraburkholderia TaxID=1822464 RepID=UPI002253248E|nr:MULTISPECIES: hypothetical protein [Paraburkholderia]MCX4170694.1 hypothetical protein [Paraburkholderia madseniana]MDQ6458706.1 hypothetical protein [Paraburkholderia madseniana]
MILSDSLFNAVRHIRRLYPQLKRSEIPNDALRNALATGRDKLQSVMDFVEAYAFLKARGHQSQAAFIAVFLPDAGAYLKPLINRVCAGVSITEGSDVYRSALRVAMDDVTVFDLWDDAIATAELERLSDEVGETSKVGREALRIRDCIVSVQHTAPH